VAGLVAGAALAVVLEESGPAVLRDVVIPSAGDVVLVVGPEGGITAAEAAVFAAAGAYRARIGPTVLRTSTAGTVAAAVVLAAGARWA
jgi:16S rRNA (uracil1498-N3)-methyltransferase